MKSKKFFAIVLTGFLTLLVSSTVYGIPLNEDVQDQVSSMGADLTTKTTIPYTGNLSDGENNPVADGIYAFKFSILEDQTNKEPLWSEEQQGVEVDNGVFTVQLGSVQPLPAETLQSDQLFLQIAVRADIDETYTTLNPPQVLQPVSASNPERANVQAACAHDHLGEEWIFNGSTEGLTIENNSAGAIYGKNTDGYGVRGESDSHIGVHGKSNSSFGVRGDSDTTVGIWGSSNSGSGVTGASVSHIGVIGESELNYGGYFKSDADSFDLGLGGTIGGIEAKDYDNSELFLSSNADITLKLDDDGGEDHILRVMNSDEDDVCTINEDGDLECQGQIVGFGEDGGWSTIKGYSGTSIGIAGISHENLAIYFPDGKYGVYGFSRSDHGVYGLSLGDWSYRSGVYGEARADHANGVTGWNTAAGPGVYGYSESGDAGYFAGTVNITGNLSKGGGGFKIDHPLDPENQYLNHSFVESPDMKNVYDGVVVLDANGEAWLELPDWFETLNKDFRYQLTAIGAPAPGLYIGQEIEENRFQIAGGTPDLKVSWQVTGIRHDPYAEAHRIPVEEEKAEEEIGTYLHPVELGQPANLGLDTQ